MLQRGIYLVESMFWKRRQIAVVNIRCPLKAKRCTYKYKRLLPVEYTRCSTWSPCFWGKHA